MGHEYSLRYALCAAAFCLLTLIAYSNGTRDPAASLQSTGNQLVRPRLHVTDIPTADRLKIETSIQKAAERLERQIPEINNYQTAYRNIQQLEDTDEQADHVLQNDVKALAETSVAKRTSAVIDMAKASQELQVAALHQRIASVMADKSEMLRGHAAEVKSEAEAAAAEVKKLQARVATLQATAHTSREDADAELLSAKHLLKSAKQIDTGTSESSVVKERSLGERLDDSLAKARQVMQGDTRALARAEWKLHSLKGYQGATDDVSRIAEEIESNSSP